MLDAQLRLDAARLVLQQRPRHNLNVCGDGERLEPVARDGVQVIANCVADRIRFLGEVDRSGKQKFLNSIDILSVPTIYEEPKGLYALEALAHGVPIVQPRHGSFPEMIEATGGGLLVEPHSAAALAERER